MVTNVVGGTPLDQARGRVKTLTDAFRIYLADSDDVTPPVNRWMDSLQAYVPDESVFLAPGVGNPGSGIYGFAMNEDVAGRSMNTFPDRSIVPLFFDSTVTSRNATASTTTLPVPGRYDGKNVISYLDGFQEGYDVLEESRRRLRGLATGLLLYAGDHDDRFPGPTWMDDLTPYVRQSRSFRSPAFDMSTTEYGYALNEAVAGKMTVEINNPDQTVAIFDSTNLARNAIAPLSTKPNPGRYSGYNTLAMADGSTRFEF